MSNVKFFTDGIGIDENGRYVPIPMDLTKLFPKEEEKPRIRRPKIQISPMKFVPLVEQESKKRKVDTAQEKPIFRVPQKIAKPAIVQRLSFRPSSVKRKNSLNPQGDRRVSVSKVGSAVSKIDKVKTTLFPSGSGRVNKSTQSPRRKVKMALFQMQDVKEEEELAVELKTTPVASDNKENLPSSNESLRSELEFLRLEQALASAKKPPNNLSKITTICCENEVEDSVVERVEQLLKADELQMKSLTKQFEKFQQEHKERMNEIMALLKGDKTKRRSSRVHQKQENLKADSPLKKKEDLRKSTLRKNLSKSVNEGSPKTRAVNLYKSLKNDCSVLCTPSNNRMDVSGNATQNLSKKLQEQCMLLQETPKL